ncbi:MAG: nitrogen regulation protein NR(I) [Gammaproteobacteria bacterium]
MQAKVWVVDDDRSIRWVLEKALTKAEMHVTCFEDADSALEQLKLSQPDVIISDIRMPGTNGLNLLDEVQRLYTDLPVIIMTAYADLGRAVAAFQGGAFEYLPKPFDIDEAVTTVRRAVRSQKEQPEIQDSEPVHVSGIIGAAPAMQEVFRAIGRLSRSNMTVLLTGESGTGKELVARALHDNSPRVKEPFIAINTAAIPKDLLESELFGHEKGAFTGAAAQRKGRFEQADSGSLFLDEIGDMPAELQTRLLRVLADGEFYRVGGHTPIKVDVRIIAATHQKLEDLVLEGSFREDLFHRLNVIRLKLPALRERSEDISILMNHFLKKVAKELRIETKTLHADTEYFLQHYDWPGNVRQLENVCRWLMVMAPAQQILIEELPPEITNSSQAETLGDWQLQLKSWVDTRLAKGDIDLLEEATQIFESIMIKSALMKTGGRRQDAAKLLGCGRNTLTRKIKELEIEE